ncbi:hypothetical protein AOQ84DRAFT_437131 [Glonium stellatum]|uniref:Uncharacterized protein n=1 Tax=Glonium stellatum TaxID=574774 RepID=A0A8E2F805_9PEZI|nr:hypothetical protein AOQ84DRAFT_437131 [Glonium stellatum]
MAPQGIAHQDTAITMQHDRVVAYVNKTRLIFTDFLEDFGPYEPKLLEEFEQIEDSELIKQLEVSESDESILSESDDDTLSESDDGILPGPAPSQTPLPMLSRSDSEPIQLSRIISMPANEEMPTTLLLKLSERLEHYQQVLDAWSLAQPKGSNDNEEGNHNGLGMECEPKLLRRLMRNALYEKISWDADVDISQSRLCDNRIWLAGQAWDITFALVEFFEKYGTGNETEIEFLEEIFQLPRDCIRSWKFPSRTVFSLGYTGGILTGSNPPVYCSSYDVSNEDSILRTFG